MNRFTLSVLAANHPLYVGECCSLVVPIAQGRYGILAHHSNTLAAIVPGLLEFTLPDGSKRTATVSKGIIKIENNEVLLLVDAVESAEEPTDHWIHNRNVYRLPRGCRNVLLGTLPASPFDFPCRFCFVCRPPA